MGCFAVSADQKNISFGVAFLCLTNAKVQFQTSPSEEEKERRRKSFWPSGDFLI